MKTSNTLFLLVGLFIGWFTVPFLHADSEGNTYKALLHRVIDIVAQIQMTSQQTADNTRVIKEKLGAK